MFKKNETCKPMILKEILFETRKKIEKVARENKLKTFTYVLLAQDRLFTKVCF